MVWYGTRCTEQDCGWLGKVPSVRNEIVDGFRMVPAVQNGLRLWMVLEWCPQYRMGCG
jgi:hypothetical protein